MGVVAYYMERHDAGELEPPQPAYLVDENVWRAIRYGTDARFIDLPSSNTRPAAEVIGELIENARGAGKRAGLGLDEGLDRAQAMLDRGCAAKHQRELAATAGGDLKAAYERIVALTMGRIESLY
jgi:carboxylate-amine ligase